MKYIILKEGDILREGDEFSYFEKETCIPNEIKETCWEKVTNFGTIIIPGETTSPRASYRRFIDEKTLS